ncbi:HD domain-containing protein [Protofrankia symbiont of Coriaria ruscifolia]|uniref:HD domain-containing protein n=1 Tax=Protofrankia symbiont of Coriaria ruscifolia TaxID=1306542 RepID=UPI0013EF900E|nr:HD domain-containing protein [Protofrankia symbiont of Coriaria ruscifolia]
MNTAGELALQVLHERAGAIGTPLEHHSERVYELAVLLAPTADRELLRVAALMHDIGVLEPPGRTAYVTVGAERARDQLESCGWQAERIRSCADAVERHHELRRQIGRGVEVEAIRRADLIDLSSGLIRFGVLQADVQAVSTRHPRRGFTVALARIVGGLVLHAPRSLPAVFRPPT